MCFGWLVDWACRPCCFGWGVDCTCRPRCSIFGLDFYLSRPQFDCCGVTMTCSPLAFLIGLPFALASLALSVIGVFILIIGLALSCICPRCLCVTDIVDLAQALIKAPFYVMKWFTEKIPC